MADRDLAAWVRLTSVPGVGAETQRRLLRDFGLPENVFAADYGSLRASVGEAAAQHLATHDSSVETEAALAWAQEAGNHIVTLADPEYPQALLTGVDPPVLLYVKGRVELLNCPSLAIVGARSATRQGEANAEAFAKYLSDAGLAIVSGLALGIDAAAHRGALAGGASTVAVIGTGADRIYPAGNADLARRIAEQGAVVSEFPLGTPPLTANFPRRNRIIAGMSRGCLVVEAAERSGSLITARLAAESGNDVFAIPGSIHSPMSKGCHKLIKQGAKLVETAADILEELKWESAVSPVGRSGQAGSPGRRRRRGQPEAMAQGGADPVLLALGGDICDLDTLCQRTGLAADALLAQLLPLELEGKIAQLPGGRYQRLG